MRRIYLLVASIAAALFLASSVAMVATLAVPEEAQAAFPGINAKIVFVRDPDGLAGPKDSEIYTIWFDGNNLTPLTNNTRPDTAPAWSADGKKIVFERGRNLYTMSANGSNQKKVPNATFYNYWAGGGNPAFSPSGRKIIYDAGGDIYTTNVDGTNSTRITDSQGGDPYGDNPLFSNPVWSPVSNKIAFNYFFGYGYTYVKYLPNLLDRSYLGDGGGVTPGGWSYRPDWSPNGSQLVFECRHDPCNYDPNGNSVNRVIYKANANGTGDPIRLTNDPATDTYPAFSPGGGKIVFSSNRDGDYDLYITKADGTGDPQPLTTNSAKDVLPDWQPVQ